MFELSSLKGNSQIKTVLETGKALQSIVIEGEKGSGRHTLAELLVNAFVCSDKEKNPCGKCPACKKYAAGSHLDIIRFSGSVSVKELRDEYISDVIRFPSEGGKKVYVIDSADDLRNECQNALLKSIEEPPTFVIFILICNSAKNLLPTIRSRCTVFTMTPLSDGVIREELLSKYPQAEESTLKKATALSKGFIGKAFSEYEKLTSGEYAETETFIKAFAKQDYTGMLSVLEARRSREELKLFIRDIRTTFKIALADRAAGREITLNAVSEKFSATDVKKLSAICEVLDEAATSAEININQSLWSVYTVKQLLKATR